MQRLKANYNSEWITDLFHDSMEDSSPNGVAMTSMLTGEHYNLISEGSCGYSHSGAPVLAGRCIEAVFAGVRNQYLHAVDTC